MRFTEDASNLRAEHDSDALGELYHVDDWPEDDRPTLAEVLRDEAGYR